MTPPGAVGLRRDGYSVITALDGQEGLKAAAQQLPDLILLDIMMPRKDGMSMLRDLQVDDKTRGIPVIMVTAKGENSSVFEGRDCGATDYIIKPIDFEQLLKYIRRYAPDVTY